MITHLVNGEAGCESILLALEVDSLTMYTAAFLRD